MFLIKSKNSPYYQIVYIVNGRRTKKSTKKTTIKEAQRFLSQFNPEKEARRKNSTKILLSRFQHEYIEYISSSKSKHYLRSVKLSFSQLLSFGDEIYLQNLSTKNLDKFITSTFARAPKAAGLYYRTLKGSL